MSNDMKIGSWKRRFEAGPDGRYYRLCVWHDPDTAFYPVRSPEHAALLREAIAYSELLDRLITDNSFFLQVIEDFEWVDWEAEDGTDFDEWSGVYLESHGLFEPAQKLAD